MHRHRHRLHQDLELHPVHPPTQPTEGSATTLEAPLIQTLFGLTPSAFGVGGILAGASLVFFAYIGFGVVATRRRPRTRRATCGIILPRHLHDPLLRRRARLTGMVHAMTKLSSEASLAKIFEDVGKPFYATLISAGAVAGRRRSS